MLFYKRVSNLFKVDRHVDLLEVAQETDGFSGSDLKEMCRDAALLCVREYVNSTSEERYLCLDFISSSHQTF
jgi:ATP-dependent 26S proteasome regulatory subunit